MRFTIEELAEDARRIADTLATLRTLGCDTAGGAALRSAEAFARSLADEVGRAAHLARLEVEAGSAGQAQAERASSTQPLACGPTPTASLEARDSCAAHEIAHHSTEAA